MRKVTIPVANGNQDRNIYSMFENFFIVNIYSTARTLWNLTRLSTSAAINKIKVKKAKICPCKQISSNPVIFCTNIHFSKVKKNTNKIQLLKYLNCP